MELNNRLYELFVDQAKSVIVETLNVGLGYTGVVTSDGGFGISYTYFENKHSCSLRTDTTDFEGKPSSDLLEKIKDDNPIERSMALALINALNHEKALTLPEDKTNSILFEKFDIGRGTRVAMVGFFGPMMEEFKKRGALLEIHDLTRGIGQKEALYIILENWADVLIMTATSILNNTTEEILSHVDKRVKTVVLGPSTPMVGEAFEHLPVHMLAGTVPLDKEKVLKAIRHGMGTRIIHKFSRKSFLSL